MSWRGGIIGLPNAGKTTIFNALTGGAAEVAAYPFCTINPNTGVVPVPDPRLARLGELLKPQKLTPTTIEFVDVAGLIAGASRGEGLGNQFLASIRDVDLLVHVVRCFDDERCPHPLASLDPVRDVEVVETELLLADLEILGRQRLKVEKRAQAGDKAAAEALPPWSGWRPASTGDVGPGPFSGAGGAGTPGRHAAFDPETLPVRGQPERGGV